jgi:hypothetical protein
MWTCETDTCILNIRSSHRTSHHVLLKSRVTASNGPIQRTLPVPRACGAIQLYSARVYSRAIQHTPPSDNSSNRLTLASHELHRPRSHILRLTGCHFGTLKDMSSSGRSLDPSALSLNELRKNALLCRRRSLTAVSNPAARTLVLRPHARLCSSRQVSTNAGTAAVKADLMRVSSRRGGRLERCRWSDGRSAGALN